MTLPNDLLEKYQDRRQRLNNLYWITDCRSWLHPQRCQRGLGFGPAPLHPRGVAPAVHPHMPVGGPGNTFTMAFPSSSPVPPYKPVQCDLAPPRYQAHATSGVRTSAAYRPSMRQIMQHPNHSFP